MQCESVGGRLQSTLPLSTDCTECSDGSRMTVRATLCSDGLLRSGAFYFAGKHQVRPPVEEDFIKNRSFLQIRTLSSCWTRLKVKVLLAIRTLRNATGRGDDESCGIAEEESCASVLIYERSCIWHVMVAA